MSEIFRREPGLEVRGTERGWQDYLVYTPRTSGFHWISKDAWRMLESACGRTYDELLEAEFALAPVADANLVRRRIKATIAALIETEMLHAEIESPAPNQQEVVI
jgi:hypothetical protein